jgi:DnaK suppressor protein
VKTTKQSKNSKAKTQSAAKKVTAPKVAHKKAPAKKVPAQKSIAKKPVVKKPIAKKPAAKKVVAKKAVAKKAVVKKPVAKKPVAKKVVQKPVAKKVTVKKPEIKKTIAKTAVANTKTASQKAVQSKSKPKTPPVAKKPLPAKTVPKSVTTATKPKNSKSVAVKAAPVKPVAPVATQPAAEVAKKSPRAAKAMAMMPPPPGQSVASTSAKSSYGPISVPIMPSFVPVIPVKDPKLANNWKTKSAETVTEAEVMAMSDDDYMNSFQLSFFRHKLVQLKNDILVNAGETTEHLREDTVIVPDPADRATIEEEHALELRTRDRERKLLKKIEQSIHRIDSGDYGYCDETGEPIGVGRLIARPTATLSLEAQQRRELKQKMFGD